MKAAELNRIDESVEKYTGRIWDLAHSETYRNMDKSLLKDAIKKDSKEQFNEVKKFIKLQQSNTERD